MVYIYSSVYRRICVCFFPYINVRYSSFVEQVVIWSIYYEQYSYNSKGLAPIVDDPKLNQGVKLLSQGQPNRTKT